jgi:hypothetical protein
MSKDESTESTEESVNYLTMSDEEFLDRVDETQGSTTVEDNTETEDSDDNPSENSEELPDDDNSTADQEDDGTNDTPDTETPETNDDNENESADSEDTQDKEPDYKELYSEFMAPFKANGVEMNPESIQDRIALMQMGANYHKKMHSLKPALKTLKMLEKEQMLDEDKLSFLIDVSKGDPTAVAKLIKDNNIDVYNIDEEKEYSKKSYSITDKEYEVDEVINELKTSENFDKVIGIVDGFDDNSKQMIIDSPEIMKVLDGHVSSGVYDAIVAKIEQEKALGRLGNVSELEAYETIGKKMYESGELKIANEEPPSPKQEVKKSIDKKVEKARKSMAPVKSKPVKKRSKQEYNPLAMSDEEFEKQFGNGMY